MSDLPEVAHLMRLAVLGISASVIYIYIRRFTGRVAARLLDWTPTSRRERLLMTIIATLLTIVAVFLAVHFYVYSGLDYQPDIYRTGNPKTNQVALTFDDGPSQEFTPFVLDILREYNAPATFFLVGVHVERCPDIARRIAEEGHEIEIIPIGMLLCRLRPIRLSMKEVIKATRVITQVTGEYPKYIRPPRGWVRCKIPQTFPRLRTEDSLMDHIYSRLAVRHKYPGDSEKSGVSGERRGHNLIP